MTMKTFIPKLVFPFMYVCVTTKPFVSHKGVSFTVGSDVNIRIVTTTATTMT